MHKGSPLAYTKSRRDKRRALLPNIGFPHTCESTMRIISARIIDSTHLELSEPLQAQVGEMVEISLRIGGEDEVADWRKAGKQHLLDAYADEDAVYDEL